MGSKGKKKAVLQEKLEILRTVTNSSARGRRNAELLNRITRKVLQQVNKASIIIDATKYIKELKQKVEEEKQELEQDNNMPTVLITTLEKGFHINVLCEKSWPGLLASILEAFEDLRLEVLNANALCSGTFRFEAVGGESEENVDAQMVRQVVIQAIKKCMERNE